MPYSLFSLAVRILFGLRVPHIMFVLRPCSITGRGCLLYSSSLPNASKPTNNLSHFPRRHLPSLLNHFVKVLRLHEHILLSSLNIALYFVNETLPYILVHTSIFFYSKPTLPKKHCSWELSLNYHLCRGLQCHIIFVANQTCLIFGKVFTMPRDRKKRSAVVMAIFLLMKKLYNHRQWLI